MTEAPVSYQSNYAPSAPLSVVIMPMQLADVQHVSRLERRCYAIPWSSSAYVTEIGNPAAYYSVAKDGAGIIVGYAGMWVIMGEAHITTIAVDPESRTRKVGERLLLDLLDHGVKRRARRASLEVREHNTPAHRLYLKFGFVDVALRKRYYSDNGENAIIMWINDLFAPPFMAMIEQRRRELASIE